MSSATMSNSGEKMVAEARGRPSRTRSPRRRRELGFGGLGLLDRDHPLVADLFRRVADQLANRLVAVGRDRAERAISSEDCKGKDRRLLSTRLLNGLPTMRRADPTSDPSRAQLPLEKRLEKA
jgi:hypothetical protein